MAVDSLTSVFFIVSLKCNCLKKQGHIINTAPLQQNSVNFVKLHTKCGLNFIQVTIKD